MLFCIRSAVFSFPRRGVPCRDTMIAGILDGLTLRDVDTVLMVDVVPNRLDTLKF